MQDKGFKLGSLLEGKQIKYLRLTARGNKNEKPFHKN